MVAFLIVLVLLVAVLGAVASPWRWSDGKSHQADDRVREVSVTLEDLEAERDAKYREIRDAELDQQTGKLSDRDFRALDAELRAEAVEILKRLDRAQTRLAKLQKRESEVPVLDATGLPPGAADGDEQLPSRTA
jgi:hypothetical protein